jgi:hypothetical protein
MMIYVSVLLVDHKEKLYVPQLQEELVDNSNDIYFTLNQLVKKPLIPMSKITVLKKTKDLLRKRGLTLDSFLSMQDIEM